TTFPATRFFLARTGRFRAATTRRMTANVPLGLLAPSGFFDRGILDEAHDPSDDRAGDAAARQLPGHRANIKATRAARRAPAQTLHRSSRQVALLHSGRKSSPSTSIHLFPDASLELLGVARRARASATARRS